MEKNKDELEQLKNMQIIETITADAYTNYILDSSFIVFTSTQGILYLIYLSKKNTIIIFNLNDNKKIVELNHVHKTNITGFKHFLDKKNKRDLFMSISSEDNTIIVWDLNNLQNILNIVNINKGGMLSSACFLDDKDKDTFYIVTSNCSQSPFYINFDPIKIFDSKGQQIKEIKESNERTYYMDAYYDNIISNKNYIVTCNFNYIKSYNYENNKLYKKYYDKDEGAHFTFNIYDYSDKQINIIESSNIGTIRIWNFHTGELLNKIVVNNKRLFSICLWNKECLFSGCDDGNVYLFEMKNGNWNFEQNFEVYKGSFALTLKKIKMEKYGECLISKGFQNNQIKILGFKNQ